MHKGNKHVVTPARSTRTRMGISVAVLAAAVSCLGMAGTAAAAITYNFVNLGLADGSDPSNGNGSGNGISNSATLPAVEVVSSYSGQAQYYSVGTASTSNLGSNGNTLGSVNGVNTGGIAVGSYTPASTTEAFYSTGSSPTATLKSLPPMFPGIDGTVTPTVANAVNGTASGFTAVGKASYSGGQVRAFAWSSTSPTLTPLDPVVNGAASITGLGAPVNQGFSEANGISSIASGGLIVGQATNANLDVHGFLFSPATNKMYDLGQPGLNSDALGINSTGTVIAGTTDYIDPISGDPYTRAIIYTGYNVATVTESGSDVHLNGSMTDIGALDGTNSEAIAVNAAGLVVGYSSFDGTGSDDHAFVYDSSAAIPVMEDLNTVGVVSGLPVGWSLDSATGVNDLGDVIGYADDGLNDGNTYAFLLTPVTSSVPEPATGMVVLAGAALMSLRRRRA